MKMFKRFAAALLTGVLALAVLTACGGAPEAKTVAQQTEDAAVKAFFGGMAVEPDNNTQLRKQVYEALNHVQEDGTLTDLPADGKSFDEAEVTLQDALDKGTACDVIGYFLCDDNQQALKIETDADVEDMTTFMKYRGVDTGELVRTYNAKVTVGIAARTVNGKTYIGMAFHFVLPEAEK